MKRKDKNETSISTCAELSSKENDTLKDSKYLVIIRNKKAII